MTRAQTKLGFKLLTFVLMLGVGSLQGLAIAQPQLRITSPKDKTVFGPGDKVDVNVEGSGANFEGVLVGVGSLPIKAFTSPPFRYSLEIPAAIESGKYSIMAHGWVKPGEAVDADPVDLIVDRRDRPITLRLEPSRLSPRWGDGLLAGVGHLRRPSSRGFCSLAGGIDRIVAHNMRIRRTRCGNS